MIPGTETTTTKQAEIALVGGLMVPHRADEYYQVRELLSPGDFETNAARLVFEAIGDVLAAGAVVDMEGLQVSEALRQRRVKTMQGETDALTAIGPVFLAELAAAAQYDYRPLAKVVKNHATARQIRAVGDELHRLAGLGLEASELLAGAESAIGEATAGTVAGGAPLQLYDMVREQADQAQIPLNRGLLGIPTGSRRLDALTCGFLPGKVYTIVGRPGSGKSAKAWNHGYHAAKSGYWAHMFSLEMPPDEIAVRALANLSSIDSLSLMRRLPFDEVDRRNIELAVKDSAVPFTFDCDLYNFERIMTRARSLARKGCQLFIFDYLLLFETNRKFDRDELRIAYFTRNLKQLARQCNVPVIDLTQYKKEGEEEIPILEHVYGASAIRNDADYIELLFSPVKVGEVHAMQRYIDTEYDRYELMSGIIAKHRGGPTGRVNYMFTKHLARYEDFAGEIRSTKNETIQKDRGQG